MLLQQLHLSRLQHKTQFFKGLLEFIVGDLLGDRAIITAENRGGSETFVMSNPFHDSFKYLLNSGQVLGRIEPLRRPDILEGAQV